MRDLTFTLYRNATSTRGTPRTLPWETWVRDYFSKHDIRASTNGDPEQFKDGPAVVLGEILSTTESGHATSIKVECPRCGRKPCRYIRAAVNVVGVHALSIDIEHHNDDRVRDLLINKLQKFEYVVYTTHRHGTEVHPRLRVILPLEEAHSAEDHKSIWLRFNSFIGGMNDPNTKDPSRLLYMPSTWKKPVEVDDAWADRNTSAWISVNDLPVVSKVETKESSDFAIQSGLANLKQKLLKEPKTSPHKAGINALLAGQPFADKGERHNFILGLTMGIAYRMPSTPIESVVALFAPSFAVMEDTDQDEEAVRAAYIGALEKAEAHKAEQKEERAAEAHAVQLNGQEPYSEADLKAIAASQGFAETADLKNAWIVQADSTYYILEPDGYSQPFSYMEARPAAARCLARAPVTLNVPTKNGVDRKKIQDLVEDYGTQAKHLIADLTIQKSVFDPVTRTMREAAAPWRNLKPTYDADIENWLRTLAGDDRHFEKLMNWMACAPDLSKTLCAIYLAGDSGGGKTLFAKGIAKIWTEGGCSEIHRILKDNNAELIKCPVVLADEAVPKRWQGNSTTTILRSMISDTTRTLARKYKAPADLCGALRLVLAANNEHLLNDPDDAPGAQDREAVGQRFLCLEVGPAATKYIAAIEKKYSIQEKWLDQDGIAKFCLYLNQTRKVEREGRFWVMGVVESKMSRRASTGGSDWNAWTTEWLVRYLEQPNMHDSKGNGFIVRGGGELLVNGQAIVDGFNAYLKITKRDPDSQKIGAALGAISGKKVQRRWRGRQIWYHPVKVDYLLDWIARGGMGDAELVRANVLTPRKSDDGAPPSAPVARPVAARPPAPTRPPARPPTPPRRRSAL